MKSPATSAPQAVANTSVREGATHDNQGPFLYCCVCCQPFWGSHPPASDPWVTSCQHVVCRRHIDFHGNTHLESSSDAVSNNLLDADTTFTCPFCDVEGVSGETLQVCDIYSTLKTHANIWLPQDANRWSPGTQGRDQGLTGKASNLFGCAQYLSYDVPLQFQYDNLQSVSEQGAYYKDLAETYGDNVQINREALIWTRTELENATEVQRYYIT